MATARLEAGAARVLAIDNDADTVATSAVLFQHHVQTAHAGMDIVSGSIGSASVFGSSSRQICGRIHLRNRSCKMKPPLVCIKASAA